MSSHTVDRPRVLLVDDEPRVLEALTVVLGQRWVVETAGDGAGALSRLREGRPYSVVISDMRMPRMSGSELLARTRAEFPETVRVMLTGEGDLSAAILAINHGGVFRFLVKPCPPDVLRETLDDAVAEHRRIVADRRRRREAVAGSVRSLALAVDAKDPSTRQHSERVGAMAAELAAALGWDDDRVAALRQAGQVHDVGKIGIPDRILMASGPLTPADREQMTSHCALGERIVREFMTPEQASWIRGHHERPDGTGYPDGLAGEAIPDGARVLAVADVWDVMTSGRPYARAVAGAVALAELQALVGAQFWAPAVDALEELARTGRLPTMETQP
jgi:response regulator RpfG family c-di-GMP phosphodiesterase